MIEREAVGERGRKIERQSKGIKIREKKIRKGCPHREIINEGRRVARKRRKWKGNERKRKRNKEEERKRIGNTERREQRRDNER